MANNNQWQVYLRPNALTKDNDKDCIADVHLNGATLTNEDVAQRIVSERSEYRKDEPFGGHCLPWYRKKLPGAKDQRNGSLWGGYGGY